MIGNAFDRKNSDPQNDLQKLLHINKYDCFKIKDDSTSLSHLEVSEELFRSKLLNKNGKFQLNTPKFFNYNLHNPKNFCEKKEEMYLKSEKSINNEINFKNFKNYQNSSEKKSNGNTNLSFTSRSNEENIKRKKIYLKKIKRIQRIYLYLQQKEEKYFIIFFFY